MKRLFGIADASDRILTDHGWFPSKLTAKIVRDTLRNVNRDVHVTVGPDHKDYNRREDARWMTKLAPADMFGGKKANRPPPHMDDPFFSHGAGCWIDLARKGD